MLSLNEIRARAARFAEEWKDAHYEKGETQSFYDEFWEVFGKKRRKVAKYETLVRKNDKNGFIDVFWPKWLLIEQKSEGHDLKKAREQADEYFVDLEEDLQPRFIMASDFQNFHLSDLDEDVDYSFKLSELPDKIEYFDFMRGKVQDTVKTEDPVNIKAAEMMGKIYDNLKKSGYSKHDMEYLLTRLTYCLFADDTGIFESHILQNFLQNRTSEDGSDLGNKIIQLFEVLNIEEKSRQVYLDEELNKFPFINGTLFEGSIFTPAFDSKTRNLLIEASKFNWEKVSPAIFGSLFQSVMNPKERREGGGHYTEESNIMKIIHPLFLDELTDEFVRIKSIKSNHRKKELEKFQDKLANLKFLDPACGSGNFLIIAYREIRKLELKIINELHDKRTQLLNVSNLSKVDVDQFYGIEINEFSCRIAETAIWMMDHIMNNELSREYGIAYTRIPLKKQPQITNTDALENDWNNILPASECSYILGNPPYGGAKMLSTKQREQIKRIADMGKSGGTLDYVCSWFLKASQYANEQTSIGFVSTNSITQGEQVGQLWPILFEKYAININFAHKEFKWESDARGKAIVTVVILGLSKINKKEKRLFHYDDRKIIEENPKHISPYLIGSKEELPIVKETSKSLNGLPPLIMGSLPIVGQHYIFNDDEKSEFLAKEPNSEPFFMPYIGAEEFLHDKSRWILKLRDVKPNELKNLPETKKRIAAVKSYRLKSKRPATRRLAETPRLFHTHIIPTKPFLVIPRVSSERREYLPIGYLKPPVIPSDQTMIIENASLGLFGLLMSKMHLIWVRLVGGKLETRLRYSGGVVYKTFPIPKKGIDNLKQYAQKVLDIRAKYNDTAIGDLYDPDIIPPDLKKAHLNLDHAVEKLYRVKPFNSDKERIEFLLFKYKEMIDEVKDS